MQARSTFRSVQLGAVAALVCFSTSTSPVSGQADCDGLEIISLRYAPFSDTTMQVMARSTDGLFSSPVFNLFDAQGDTVALGRWSFFGMTPAPQSHVLELHAGQAPSASPFTGTLEFNHVTIDGPEQCLVDLQDVDLCAIDVCDTVHVFAYRTGGGAPVTTTLDWHLDAADGNTLASGEFDLDSLDQQQDFDRVCAAPGAYTLQVSQDEAVGTGYAFGVTLGGQYFTVNGPIGEFDAGGGSTIDFDFYPACVEIGQAIAEERKSEMWISLTGRMLVINTELSPIGAFQIHDGMGRTVLSRSVNSLSSELDLHGFASGASFLHSTSSSWRTQRFLIL